MARFRIFFNIPNVRAMIFPLALLLTVQFSETSQKDPLPDEMRILLSVLGAEIAPEVLLVPGVFPVGS